MRRIAALSLSLAALAARSVAQSLPTLPAAAASPPAGIHERAAELLRRVEEARGGGRAEIGELQAEWDELKSIQRRYGSDPDTHVLLREIKQDLAALDGGSSAPPAKESAVPPAARPTDAAELKRATGGVAGRNAVFDGSADSADDEETDGSAADGGPDAKPGKKKDSSAAAKKTKKIEDELLKFHRHQWSNDPDDAAMVFLNKHLDPDSPLLGSLAMLTEASRWFGRRLADRFRLLRDVDWKRVKHYRLKVVDGHLILRLKYTELMRQSVDLGDVDLWLPPSWRRHRRDKGETDGVAGRPAGSPRTGGATTQDGRALPSFPSASSRRALEDDDLQEPGDAERPGLSAPGLDFRVPGEADVAAARPASVPAVAASAAPPVPAPPSARGAAGPGNPPSRSAGRQLAAFAFGPLSAPALGSRAAVRSADEVPPPDEELRDAVAANPAAQAPSGAREAAAERAAAALVGPPSAGAAGPVPGVGFRPALILAGAILLAVLCWAIFGRRR